MDYQIAIPSYKRAELLRDKTLVWLESKKVDPDRITVFVAGEEESDHYRYVLGHKYRVVTGVLGKIQQQQFYHHYYPKGTPLLNMDDDVVRLRQRTADGKLEDWQGDLDALVELGFKTAKQVGATMWGINPVENGFFLHDHISVGLRYIIGLFYGCYAGDPVFIGKDRIIEASGDDYESTIRSFIQNGSVVRFEYLCPTTKYFAAGGIDAELKTRGVADRQTDHTRVLYEMEAHYPELCKVVTKAGGIKNIRLKPITFEKLPRVDV